MKNKKVKVAIISVVALLLVLIGVTYAYWLVTKTQTNSNIISSACLDITLDSESEEINLTSQYPMSDEDGMKLTPYTFTVTNNCNTSIDYQVALESVGEEANAIKSNALKVALDNNIRILSNGGPLATTISGAYESRSIGYARLAAAGNEGSSVTHSLRIWIDEKAPISEANKTFQSKISVTIGQGIDSPYEAETLAYDILANNGGAGVSEIDATEKADRITSLGSVYIGTSSNYYYGTEYTLDESTGTYTLGGTVIQAKLTECRDGSKACGKYTAKSTSTSSTVIYEITDLTSSSGINYVTANTRKYATAFSVPTTIYDAGLYKTEDDLGESYYFRGDVKNNYVQFGQYAADYKVYTISDPDMCWETSCIYTTLETCENMADNDYDSYDYDNDVEVSCVATTSADAGKDMYWRIVRINGDGTIRLAYDGTAKVENGTAHTANVGISAYRLIGQNVDYQTSDIKEYVDIWYNTYLKANYGSYIADGIFCSDREIESEYYYKREYDEDDIEIDVETSKADAVYTDILYKSRNRLYVNKQPQLSCSQIEDRYATNKSIGNGLLTHPVGLLTADEIAFAGAAENYYNEMFYLYSGEDYWTLTPYCYRDYEDDESYSATWIASSTGGISAEPTTYMLSYDANVRPVINLRVDVEFTGNGSFETPYVITTN